MNITVSFADSDVILALDVAPDMKVADFAAYALHEAGYPTTGALLFHKENRLRPEQTLEQAGVEQDAIIVISRPSSEDALPLGGGGGTSVGDSPALREQIEGARKQLLYDPEAFALISHRLPDLAAALHDPEQFFDRYTRLGVRMTDVLREVPQRGDNQERLDEVLRQRTIDQNLMTALEEMPESFARVSMLFISIHVNAVPVKAFVDSGAQATIMSPECAERCQLSHLIDKRAAGTAFGVGEGKIVGRIHLAPIRVNNSFFSCSFTVLEGLVLDVLFGLDMLRHHQACIDLKNNVLVMGSEQVPFLSEKDIPDVATNVQAQAAAALHARAQGANLVPSVRVQRAEPASAGRGGPSPRLGPVHPGETPLGSRHASVGNLSVPGAPLSRQGSVSSMRSAPAPQSPFSLSQAGQTLQPSVVTSTTRTSTIEAQGHGPPPPHIASALRAAGIPIDPRTGAPPGAPPPGRGQYTVVGGTQREVSQVSFGEDVICRITALGFSREEAIRALERTGGNPEMAASSLFDT